MTHTQQHVYVVREIRDGVHRRTHGYYASLQGAFGYCETEERKKPLVDGARFELFAAPGGKQWLIHQYYGPKDDFPETSDFVISQHQVIPDESAAPAAQPAPADRAAILLDAADRLASAAERSPVWQMDTQSAQGHRNGTVFLLAELRRMADEQQQPETQAAQLPFVHTDDDNDQLTIGAVMASTYDGEAPVVAVAAEQYDGDDRATVYVRPERVEQLVTALRAARQQAEALPAVVSQPGKET